MIKHIFFILLLCNPLFKINAQIKDTAKYVVSFNFLHLKDTTQLDSYFKEEMYLQIGNKVSKYQSRGNFEFDSLISMKEQFDYSSNSSIAKPAIRFFSRQCFYNDYFNNKYFLEDRIAKDRFFMQIDKPSINWKVFEETKNILGFKCQKAEGFYKGRNYTVWFTLQIPYSTGPWKLQGLPGLILEASDSKNQVSFLATFIADVSNQMKVIFSSKSSLVVTNKEYNKAKELYNEDPIKYISNSTGITWTSSNSLLPKKKANNPIELAQD